MCHVCPSSSPVYSKTLFSRLLFLTWRNTPQWPAVHACSTTRLTRRNRVFLALCNADALRISSRGFLAGKWSIAYYDASDYEIWFTQITIERVTVKNYYWYFKLTFKGIGYYVLFLFLLLFLSLRFAGRNELWFLDRALVLNRCSAKLWKSNFFLSYYYYHDSGGVIYIFYIFIYIFCYIFIIIYFIYILYFYILFIIYKLNILLNLNIFNNIFWNIFISTWDVFVCFLNH